MSCLSKIKLLIQFPEKPHTVFLLNRYCFPAVCHGNSHDKQQRVSKKITTWEKVVVLYCFGVLISLPLF